MTREEKRAVGITWMRNHLLEYVYYTFEINLLSNLTDKSVTIEEYNLNINEAIDTLEWSPNLDIVKNKNIEIGFIRDENSYLPFLTTSSDNYRHSETNCG